MSRPYAVEKRESDLLARADGKKKPRPLKWWQSALAEYMGTAVKRPKPAQYVAKANELANKDVPEGGETVEITLDDVRRLFKHPGYRKTEALFEISNARAARKIIERDSPAYMRGHRMALDLAVEAKDPRAIVAATVPVLDRVWPKKQETAAPVQLVKVEMTLAQKAQIDAPDAVVEYEVVK